MEKGSYLERIMAERTELGARLERLEAFVRTPEYGRLDREERELLIVQREYMRRYAEVLELRTVRAVAHRRREVR